MNQPVKDCSQGAHAFADLLHVQAGVADDQPG
jgi:hypothetical protein